MKTLVTGAAGFIGFHTARKSRGATSWSASMLSTTITIRPSRKRDSRCSKRHAKAVPEILHLSADLADQAVVNAAFAVHRFDRVIHLAAQAGSATA
jgi:UDP-glucuronate 4-epimerase